MIWSLSRSHDPPQPGGYMGAPLDIISNLDITALGPTIALIDGSEHSPLIDVMDIKAMKAIIAMVE